MDAKLVDYINKLEKRKFGVKETIRRNTERHNKLE